MKAIIKISTIALASTMMFAACKKGDNFYVNPNAPKEVTPGLMLTAMEVSTFNLYEGEIVRRVSIYMQQNVGIENQALQVNRYILNELDFNNQWAQAYQTLFTWKNLNDKYGAANPYYSGIADIIAAMNWGMLTDMWGDIPFSDALKADGNNYQAKFDNQEQVLNGILLLLDGAIVKLGQPANANTYLPGSDDVALKGDKSAWIKIAHTLKARYMNRFSKKANYDPAGILTELSSGITSSDGDFFAVHGTAQQESNQWYAFQNNRANYILASLPYLASFQNRPTDIRPYFYFDSTGHANTLVGSPVDNVSSEASAWGTYLVGGPLSDGGNPAQHIRLLSYTETKFIEAEVKMRQNDAAGAANALNEAIKESCKTVTEGAYDGGDIATYTAANVNLGRIMYEKWLALFGSAEPYNDYRRTGLPAIQPNPAGLINVIPKRSLYPSTERLGNPNTPNASLTDAVWFAQ